MSIAQSTSFRTEPDHALISSCGILLSATGQIVLVKPRHEPGWDLPGGLVRGGESPVEACQRELKEEIGIDVTVGPIMCIDWAPKPLEGTKVFFIFDCGVLPPNSYFATADRNEIEDVRLFDPAGAPGLVSLRVAHRIRAALDPARSGPLYLEKGSIAP